MHTKMAKIVFGLLVYFVTFAFGIYDTQVLLKITSVLDQYYLSTCIEIIYKTNVSLAENEQIFRIFKKLSSRTTVGVYSFEFYLNSDIYVNHENRNCLKPVKFIIGEDDSKKEFSKLSRTIFMSNAFWFITLNSSVSQFFAEANTPFDTELIVAKVKSKHQIDFLEVYRVDEDYPLRVKNYGFWTSENGFQLSKLPLYVRRFDLEGKLLRAGSIENWPMSSFQNGVWDGYFPRIWKELEKLINCTTEPFRSVDNATGVLKTNGSWNGLVGMVVRGELDVLVSEITMNDERSKVLKFSRPVLISNYQVFFCALGRNLKWSAVLHPFSRDTWFAVCAWVVASSFTISICHYFLRKNSYQIDFTPTSSFFFILQSLCQQGYPRPPKLLACKIIFVTSYLLSAVLIPSYSASLIYSLTHHTPIKPFNTFEEFLSLGRYELNVIRNSAQQAYFKRSVNNSHRLVYSTVRRNKRRVLSVKEGLERSLCYEDDQAFFGVEAIVDMHLKHSPTHSCCHIATFARPLSPVYQCLAFLKGSPYGDLVNYKLQRLFTTGIIDNIQKYFQFRSRAIKSYNTVEVGIEDVFQIFILLSIGLAISFTIFFAEKIYAVKLANEEVVRKVKKKKCIVL